ncbi:hypothetical protein GCM10010331_37150 [Streptomyces xanthochromogenes]|nr:hypothetical protein GCM10010331_37150 [Streptomyces xanthochromogenes]
MTRAAAESAAVAARRVNPGKPKGLFEYKELPSMGGWFAGSGRAARCRELDIRAHPSPSGCPDIRVLSVRVFGGTDPARSAVRGVAVRKCAVRHSVVVWPYVARQGAVRAPVRGAGRMVQEHVVRQHVLREHIWREHIWREHV